METNFICCDYFKEFAGSFVWFYYEMDGVRIWCMPSMEVGEHHWRVNHCPSCGKEMRSCLFTDEVYETFKR